MRSQRGLLSDDRAAAFLVLDREFPRSVFFALTEAERRLRRPRRPEEERIGVSDEARRQLGRIRTSLEFRATVRRHRRPARADAAGAGAPSWPPRTPSPSATSSPARCRRGPRTGCSDVRRFRIVHTTSLALRRAGAGRAQRAADDPGQRARPDHAREPHPDPADDVEPRLPRPLGHPRHGDGEPVRARRGSTSRRLTVERTPVEPARAVAGLDGRARPRRAGPQLRVADALAPAPGPAPGIAELAEAVRGLPTPRAAAEELCGLVRDEMQLRARGDRRCTAAARTPGPSGPGSARTSPTSPSGRCAASGSRPATSPATSCPSGTSAVGETSTGESHAWVEFWDDGWVACDPTNGTEVGSDHVVVARGRDYEDVPPFKGIYSGRATASLEVGVAITRLA